MGSKNKISKSLLPHVLRNRKPNQIYVEPFTGGANMIDKVDGIRIGGELNEYIVEMWQALQNGWIPRIDYTREEYKFTRENPDIDKPLTGWMGTSCSYSGKWFGGYLTGVTTKDGERNYQIEAFNNVMKQLPNLLTVCFIPCSYDELFIPDNSIIYCDSPYKGTTGYKDKFNHDSYFQWCREKVIEGHRVFISEYNAPDDFVCIWSKTVNVHLSTKCNNNVEKLFVHESQLPLHQLTLMSGDGQEIDTVKHRNPLNKKLWVDVSSAQFTLNVDPLPYLGEPIWVAGSVTAFDSGRGTRLLLTTLSD